MPATVNVNNLTVVHAGSGGMSIAFPDVCKTPTPGGPIPIPYPNVAQSADTADGSSTVKVDGNPIMLKGSNFRMSSGDEAGSAMGVVSSRIKGKAEYTLYSFDVKADGKNVCRLSDPLEQNKGSGNAFGPAWFQAPLVVAIPQMQACDKIRNKQKTQAGPESAWGNSGIIPKHRAPIQKVVDKQKVIIYFRNTNPLCEKWIASGHRPKPHHVFNAKTISPDNIQDVRDYFKKLSAASGGGGAGPLRGNIWIGNEEFFCGIVMVKEGEDKGKPMAAEAGDRSFDGSRSYDGKWITGDYDVQDIMFVGDECERPPQTGTRWAQIKDELNSGMGWDGIQHGPQAQWRPKDDKGKTVNFPQLSKDWLRSSATNPGKVTTTVDGQKRDIQLIDEKLTVVAPKGCVIALESFEEVKNALICCGCAR